MNVKCPIHIMLTPEEFAMLPDPLTKKRQAGGGRSGFIRQAIREKFEREKKQAREALDRLRGASLESAIAKGTEAWKDVESSSWVEELRGNVDA